MQELLSYLCVALAMANTCRFPALSYPWLKLDLYMQHSIAAMLIIFCHKYDNPLIGEQFGVMLRLNA